MSSKRLTVSFTPSLLSPGQQRGGRGMLLVADPAVSSARGPGSDTGPRVVEGPTCTLLLSPQVYVMPPCLEDLDQKKSTAEYSRSFLCSHAEARYKENESRH